VNGAWRDVDNTPASWVATEAARATSWEKVSDAWSRVWFEFSKWRWGKGEWKRYLIWLVIPLIGLTVWRLMTQKQWSRARQKAAANGSVLAQLGLDSEFYLIEQKLLELGLGRRDGETLAAWLARVGREGGIGTAGLTELLTLHYRLRFDPAGLSAAERVALRSEAMEWVGRNGSLTAKS
jgi:hypothetical protein